MVRAYFMTGENVSAALRLYRELYPSARQRDHVKCLPTVAGLWQFLHADSRARARKTIASTRRIRQRHQFLQ